MHKLLWWLHELKICYNNILVGDFGQITELLCVSKFVKGENNSTYLLES